MEVKNESLIFFIILFLIGIYLLYLLVNYPNYQRFALAYLFTLIFGFIAIILSKYAEVIDKILIDFSRFNVSYQTALALVFLVLYGLVVSNLNFIKLSFEPNNILITIIPPIVETFLFTGIIFPTFLSIFRYIIFSNVLKTDYKEYKEMKPYRYYTIIIPLVIISSFITAQIFSIFHSYVYSGKIELHERARLFEIISDILAFSTNSIYPGILIHLINNLLAT